MKIKIISKEVLTSGNTTVAKVRITDGYCFAEGDGKARCADGDEFDSYTGKAIACKRAVIKATKKLIKANQLMVNAYEKALAKMQQHTDGIKAHLAQFESDLDYLIHE